MNRVSFAKPSSISHGSRGPVSSHATAHTRSARAHWKSRWSQARSHRSGIKIAKPTHSSRGLRLIGFWELQARKLRLQICPACRQCTAFVGKSARADISRWCFIYEIFIRSPSHHSRFYTAPWTSIRRLTQSISVRSGVFMRVNVPLDAGRLDGRSLRTHREEQPMLDVILLAGGVAFFALSIAYAFGCDRL